MAFDVNFPILQFVGHFSSSEKTFLKAMEAIPALFASRIVTPASTYPCGMFMNLVAMILCLLL